MLRAQRFVKEPDTAFIHALVAIPLVGMDLYRREAGRGDLRVNA